MPSFGKRSSNILKSVHPDIILVLNEVITYFDFSVISGHRGQKEQTDIFNAGNSKTPWPQSKHNKAPSWAVDIAPYPVDWDYVKQFIYLAGHIMSTAHRFGVPMRWGGDWSMNNMRTRHVFKDWGHFELKG